jgi:hypothetical protein
MVLIIVLSLLLPFIIIPIAMSICCQGDSENQPEYPDGYSRTDFLKS